MSAELELSSRRQHLEHLATPTAEFGPLGGGAVAQRTTPLGIGH